VVGDEHTLNLVRVEQDVLVVDPETELRDVAVALGEAGECPGRIAPEGEKPLEREPLARTRDSDRGRGS